MMRRSGQAILDARGTGEQWQNYRAVINYVARYRLGLAKKGLLLMGGTGTGKTTLLRVMVDLIKIEWRQADQIAEFAQDDAEEFRRALRLKWYDDARRRHFDALEADMVIDDIGTEPAEIMVFGTRKNPLSEAIHLRHIEWQNHGIKTHFSTNLSPDEIVSRYSARTWSRLNEMCELVEIGGADRRIRA